MQHNILANGDMIISCTPAERAALQEEAASPEFKSDKFMHELLEPLICNSELDWCDPEMIGALTDAPVLAIYGQSNILKPGVVVWQGNRLVGNWDGHTWVEDVLKAWAFMDYQVISVQEKLLNDGFAIWKKGI